MTYLKSHDLALPENLVAMVPVSIHEKAGGIDSKNKVSALFLRIPTAFNGPGELLGLVHEIIDRAKAVHSDLGSLFFYNAAEVIPPVFLQTVFRLATRSEIFDLVPPVFNYVVSNVPGPDIDLFLAGSRLEKVIPMAPIADGSGITFAFVSYRKVVHLGLVADPKLFPNGAQFVKLIDEFLTALLKLGD
ncbi:MAG: DUF1298 domain-containing protein [Acidimicrobiaceae bacterium]|nr:DUF1298 domain-containing protein [Acidimicrobiaceae bacterium]